MSAYMQRPTEVLMQWLTGDSRVKPRMEFYLGRLSMALEIITAIKTIEDDRIPMLDLTREETISVLMTLLQDQGLAELAYEWYEKLDEWRKPKFVADAGAESSPYGPLSDLATLEEEFAPLVRRLSQHSSDQSRGLPSGPTDE